MFKNFSIKKRVTLYYALTMISIALFVSILLSFSINQQVHIITKDTLMHAVQDSFENVDYDNQIIEIDNDFDNYVKGVTLLVYSENGNLIKGSVPSSFPNHTPLESNEYREIETDSHIWLVYDLYQHYENGQALWIRGIYALDDAIDTVSSINRILGLLLPLILLLVLFAGHRITKRAFDPIAEITDGANSIQSGGDLSKRLPQGENKDELYELSKTLNDMIERLEEAFQSEKEFTSDVSHELKTPLAVILAECEYILQGNHESEEYRESLETIEKQTRRTMSMIQQLLQISRTFNKETQIEKEIFNLSLLAEGITEELSYVATEQGIFIKSEIQQDIEISADETLVMRVIMNLMTNAIKYKRDIAESYIKLHISEENHFIKISVTDNGIGIADEEIPHIFKKFYKVDKARNREGESFGLGLSMVKWIIDAHAGSITVQSKLGEGSTFTVFLPKQT